MNVKKEEGGNRVLTDIRGGGELGAYLLMPSCGTLDGLASSSVRVPIVTPLEQPIKCIIDVYKWSPISRRMPTKFVITSCYTL